MSRLRVLVGCEFTGTVRRAFRLAGHDAWSCDLLEAEDDSPYHMRCDVRNVLRDGWDLAVFHPPCTYLSVSGLHWNGRVPGRAEKTEEALEFVRELLRAPIHRIALENPVSCISTRIKKPTQTIQPWQFGHPESKRTCLWLKNLPALKATSVLPVPASGRWANQTSSGQNRLSPGPDRWKERSRTYTGIARAMALQWGSR